MSKVSPEIEKLIEKLNILKTSRHIFLCVGDKCCSSEEGMKSWETLKELTRTPQAVAAGIFRTKVGCLRICREGPIALVYPEGVWYRGVTPEVCKLIVEKHLIGGEIVEEYKIAEHSL